MGYFYKEKKQFKKTDLLNLGKSLLKCIFNDYKLFINPHRVGTLYLVPFS